MLIDCTKQGLGAYIHRFVIFGKSCTQHETSLIHAILRVLGDAGFGALPALGGDLLLYAMLDSSSTPSFASSALE